MKLNLVKPIIFFDLETTGTDISKDRIVEICYIKVYPDGREFEYTKRINPEMHIPEGASAVHGIYDADVKDCPTFKEVAREIANEFEGCDVAGFNSNRFDLPLLAEEFLRAQVDIDLSRLRAIDVQVLYHKREPRTLSAAYKFYCGENLEDAHSALADTRATYNVLKAQLDHYDDMPTTLRLSQRSLRLQTMSILPVALFMMQTVTRCSTSASTRVCLLMQCLIVIPVITAG